MHQLICLFRTAGLHRLAIPVVSDSDFGTVADHGANGGCVHLGRCLAYYSNLADAIFIILRSGFEWIPFVGWVRVWCAVWLQSLGTDEDGVPFRACNSSASLS